MPIATERKGFKAGKNSLPLRRYALDGRDLGHGAFLQAVLLPKSWAYQQALAQLLKDIGYARCWTAACLGSACGQLP